MFRGSWQCRPTRRDASNGMAPEAAIDKAFKRADEILVKTSG
jgi:hypothetical protein